MSTAIPEDQRVEVAARALAHHKLSRNELTGKLSGDLARSIVARAAEQLWPQLKEEARAVIEALDRMAVVPDVERGPDSPG